MHASMSGAQFYDTDDRVLEELSICSQGEFVETSTGIMTLAIRRVDDCVWVRNIEYIWPNVLVLGETPPFPPNFGPDRTEIHKIPTSIGWTVPVDDTNTLGFGFVLTPTGESNPWTTNPFPAIYSGRGGRTYEEQQRTPGDYEAQISQRPIARHALEHLGVEDRGVTLYRREMRKAIRLVEQGQDPPWVLREPGKTITTYGGDTVLRVPSAPTPEEDRKLVLKAGLDLIKRHVKKPPHLKGSAE